MLLSKSGANIVISARRQAALDEVAERIKAEGGNVLTVPTDISRDEDCKNLMKAAVEKFGGIDILVNNAGVLEEGLKPIDKCTLEDVEKVYAINAKGTILCSREASKVMKEHGKGSIVNLDSAAGYYGCGGAAYVASKGAVISLTKHIAMRFAGQGIRCNSICPGTIVTPMTMQLNPAALDPDMMGQMAKHADLKVQPCMPDDVAKILLFLASDDSRPITGQVIVTDFGSSL